MAEKEVSQDDLFGQLEKNDVKVEKSAADKMKDNILNDKGGANYLGLGVHEVVVKGVELVQAKTGTMGMKWLVENADGKSDVTMWLSEGALPYTIENASRLVVHNAEKDKKDAARTMMANVVSAKELFNTVKEIVATLEKKKTPFACYLSIREDRNGATYKDKNGEMKVSLERNLLPYKPKETQVQSAVKVTGGELATEDSMDISNLPF